MNVCPVKATTECRIEESDLGGTVKRWEGLLASGSCKHMHLSKGKATPPCALNVAAYMILDSNCCCELPKCDKGEGQWLWFVASDKRKSGFPVSISVKVRSLEPALVQLVPPTSVPPAAAGECKLPIPLWLFPFSAKNDIPYSEKSCISIVRNSTYEFRRAIIEAEMRVAIDRAREEHVCDLKATISVAVPPH